MGILFIEVAYRFSMATELLKMAVHKECHSDVSADLLHFTLSFDKTELNNADTIYTDNDIVYTM